MYALRFFMIEILLIKRKKAYILKFHLFSLSLFDHYFDCHQHNRCHHQNFAFYSNYFELLSINKNISWINSINRFAQLWNLLLLLLSHAEKNESISLLFYIHESASKAIQGCNRESDLNSQNWMISHFIGAQMHTLHSILINSVPFGL